MDSSQAMNSLQQGSGMPCGVLGMPAGVANILHSAKLSARGLRPISELADRRPHGDRLRYMAGCRCNQCRRANTAYETERVKARKAGDWNGLVSADKARAHLATLSGKNVGRRSVSDVTGVASSILVEIIAGRKTRIRARTERLILAVTEAAAADRALIPAKATWKLLDKLLADGYSKTELARHLGYKRPALQLDREWVTVRNAHQVQCMYQRLHKCSAAPTLKRLAELREEEFRMDFIQERAASLAAELNLPVPDLTVCKGRIRADAADIVARLHKLLTE